MFCDRNPARLSESRFGVAGPLSRFDPMQFFSSFFLKSRVYVNRPRTLQDLKTNIQEEIANIAPAMLAGVDKRQKSVYSVYGEWGTSPTWCDLQN